MLLLFLPPKPLSGAPLRGFIFLHFPSRQVAENAIRIATLKMFNSVSLHPAQ
jgi:hypothetical protein